jgi:hypothetical protein
MVEIIGYSWSGLTLYIWQLLCQEDIIWGRSNLKRSRRTVILPKGSGALMVEVWIGTMTLQNLQQYGCQTGNKLKEKSCEIWQAKK